MGEYPFDLSPTEFVRRNVRITPLPRLHQSPVRAARAKFPDCVVFSTDYNHNEGSGAPTAYYDEVLADRRRRHPRQVPRRHDRRQSYARMGDPLPSPAAALG